MMHKVTLNYYRRSIQNLVTPPDMPDACSGFTWQRGHAGDLKRFTHDFPKNMQGMWRKIIANPSGEPFLVLTPTGRLAYYHWYLSGRTEYLEEIDRCVCFSDNEVYLYAGRTLPEFSGRRLLEFGLWQSMYEMRKEGVEWAYAIADERKAASNHVLQKLGFKIVRRYVKYRLKGISWVRAKTIIPECERELISA